MRFSVEWLAGASNKASEERVTMAVLNIFLGNNNATLHLAGEKSGSSLTMPTYSLAEGLALDWWRLFGSREREICFKHYRSGYAVPDMRMRFDGAAFEVYSEQTEYTNPPVKFWPCPPEILTRDEAENALSQFIELTIDQLNSHKIGNTTLALHWSRVRASLEDPDEREFCEAAAALGHNPYSIDERAVATIARAAEIFKGEALTEFLAGMHGDEEQRLFGWISGAREMPRYLARLNDLTHIAEEAARTKPIQAGEGWVHGYRRARAFRKALNLTDSDRIKTYKQLATRLGNANFRSKAPVDGIRVLREHDRQGVMLHLRGRAHSIAPTEQLFSLARGVGDVACFPAPETTSVNDLQHAYRQRCGRAFAAEFLAPVRETEAMWRDGKDVSTIADEFGVSEVVILHQLENKKRIEAACAI